MTPDRRPLSEILATPVWDGLVAARDIAGLVAQEELSVADLRVLDKYLRFAAERGLAAPRVEDFLSFSTGHKSAGRLIALQKALGRLMPGQPMLLDLAEARRRKARDYRGPGGAGRVYVRKYSVADSELPPAWQEILADMAEGAPGDDALAPAPEIQNRIRQKLCQLAWSARKAGLPVEIGAAAIRAYFMDLKGRKSPRGLPLRAATFLACMSSLYTFARYGGLEPETVALLRRKTREWDMRARAQTQLKWFKLDESGDTLLDTFAQGRALLESARAEKNPRCAHAQRNAACALAVFSLIPVRLADSRFVFGKSLFFSDGRYRLHINLSKGGAPYSRRLHPALTPFIDALILRGTDPHYLDEMRAECLRTHRALFLCPAGRPVSYGYVSEQWRKHVGYGEHMARTNMHNVLAALGDQGAQYARSACGQRHDRTADDYRTHSYSAQAQEFGVEGIMDDLSEEDIRVLFG